MGETPALRDETWTPIQDGVLTGAVRDALRWRFPRRARVGVDLFDGSVPSSGIEDVIRVIEECPQHTFLLFTKRPRAAASFADWMRRIRSDPDYGYQPWEFPSNVWLGVSVEDQATADERIPLLLQVPAKVRFVSADPLLGPVDIYAHLGGEYEVWEWDTEGSVIEQCWETDPTAVSLDWVIVGGATGPGARPMHPDWARSLRDQCQAAGVAFHLKHMGEWHIDDGVRAAFPAQWARVRVEGDRMCRCGKKAAGRKLDDRTWEEYPA